jgi:hypothetical protein
MENGRMNVSFRRSRKHLLDLLDREDFLQVFNELLRGSGAVVSNKDARQPKGHADPREAELKDFGPQLDPLFDWESFEQWWLPHRSRTSKTPTWDLLTTCTFDDRRKGLVLVEAKAHETELDRNGKPLPDNASESSRSNHERIGQCIEECRIILNEHIQGVNISRDSHYQLANRVAFSCHLAQCGFPVVLMYLGFLGDMGIPVSCFPFRDNEHWQRAVREYMAGVLPPHFPNQRIEFPSGGSIQMLIRSIQITQSTQPLKRSTRLSVR